MCNHSKLSDRGCEGAPDFVVEVVSPSNPGMDYVTKSNLYKEAGVREYWICDPQRKRVFAYDFENDGTPEVYVFDEPVRSVMLPAFSFDFGRVVAAM